MLKTLMFPGQGSQAKGMGAALFERFADLTARADAALGYSIRELCLDDPRDELNRTRYTQPALYVVNALAWQAWREDNAAQPTPDFLAGHSLGEFNALLAAGCFDFETGLKLVMKRGELMSEARDGAMAAIVNANREHIERTLAEHGLHDTAIANDNTPNQLVISGPVDEIERAEPLFQQERVRYLRLNTSGAFHSKFMRPAQQAFATFLQSFRLEDPAVPVISNVSARPYEAGTVADGLARQIANPVRWTESVGYLLALASTRGQEIEFVELGHGDVLTRLAHTIRRLAPSKPDLPSGKPQESIAPVVTASVPNAAEQVADWNLRHPIGARVRSSRVPDDALETRSAAMVLFGHRAAVYMKGYNGYFDLQEVTPL
ncbi:ACP S-malonyltransferase, partial [Burkholderia gladioli]